MVSLSAASLDWVVPDKTKSRATQQVSCPISCTAAFNPLIALSSAFQLTTAWTATCRHQRNHRQRLPAAITLLLFWGLWHYLLLLSPQFLVTAIYDPILGMFPPSALLVGAFHSGSSSYYQWTSRR